jgi:hypothetical protein
MLPSIAVQVAAAQEAAAVAACAKALEMAQRAHEEEERIAKTFYATGIGRANQHEMRRVQREVVRLECEVSKLGGELEAARNKSALQDIQINELQQRSMCVFFLLVFYCFLSHSHSRALLLSSPLLRCGFVALCSCGSCLLPSRCGL